VINRLNRYYVHILGTEGGEVGAISPDPLCLLRVEADA